MASSHKNFVTLLIAVIISFSAFSQDQNSEGKSSCKPCKAMLEVELPDVKILSAERVEGESSHCKVLGVIGKEINFELLLPDEWNERYLMSGGGGFSGSIQNGIGRAKVKEGYATSGTDTGHKGPGIKADWAYNNMERQLNFGHVAVHRTAVVSKGIIAEYYCIYPKYSYFMGCSRGGGQALIEAQRYPDDFDGIVAYAPIINWPLTGAEMVENTQAMYPDPNFIDKAIISPRHIEILQKEVIKQCDGLDEVEDGILNNPLECEFDFSRLPMCKGKASEECFTKEQIEAVKTVYEGTQIEGGPFYPGFPYGCENEQGGWFPWIVGPEKGIMTMGFPTLHYAFGSEMFKYLVYHDPNWDYSKIESWDFDKNIAYASSYLNATQTDYSAFKAAGGKMVIPHGWNDPALSALTAIDHYKEAKEKDPEIKDYIRLYLLPGVLHCGGGLGPDQADWVEIVRDWVENDKAPERVVVSKLEDGKTVMTRPVFPYPAKAKYKGEGDPNKEENFVEEK